MHQVETIKDAAGLLSALVMQPITANQISHFRNRGGNALGIFESIAPLILMSLAFMWSDIADDQRAISATQRIKEEAIAAAKAMGLAFRYIYQNYASLDQDVFAGYGQINKRSD